MNEAATLPSLGERIAAAFAAAVRSSEVAALIEEADTAAAFAGDKAEREGARALDPALSAADAAAARRSMKDAAFRRDRMQVAVTRLGKRVHELRTQEEDDRRRTA